MKEVDTFIFIHSISEILEIRKKHMIKFIQLFLFSVFPTDDKLDVEYNFKV